MYIIRKYNGNFIYYVSNLFKNSRIDLIKRRWKRSNNKNVRYYYLIDISNKRILERDYIIIVTFITFKMKDIY